MARVADIATAGLIAQPADMKLIACLGLIAALFAPGGAPRAQPPQVQAKVGDAYEIVMERDSSQQGGNGSSGSSHDKDTLVERVIAVRPDGLELEYDLPKIEADDERAANWQFPARVFKPHRGPLQLLNGPELEGRIDAWLKSAELPRTACGHWIFTWNAFRIECDPQSVLATVEMFDLGVPDLQDGALYHEPGAQGSAPLKRKAGRKGGATFVVELPVDPDAVRRNRAEGDAAVAEITNKPLKLEDALRERSKEIVSGTIAVTFETDAANRVRRRMKVIKLKIKTQDGRSETTATTEIVERRPLSDRIAHR